MPKPLPQQQPNRTGANDFRPAPPSPTAMVYTLLRHGRGLSHDESSRLLSQHLAPPLKAA